MPSLTYFVALPFVRTEDGVLVPEPAVETPSRNAAISTAKRLASMNAGAIAFARTGDPALGEFTDAEVIAKFGDVPEDLSDL